MPPARKVLLLANLALLLACVTTQATRLGTAPTRPALLPEAVVIYRTAEQVPGRYEEIALLTSTGESGWTNETQMYESMKKKAASIGANAIILDALSEPSAGAKVAAAVLGVGGAERKGRAIAIYVFPRDSAAPSSDTVRRDTSVTKHRRLAI